MSLLTSLSLRPGGVRYASIAVLVPSCNEEWRGNWILLMWLSWTKLILGSRILHQCHLVRKLIIIEILIAVEMKKYNKKCRLNESVRKNEIRANLCFHGGRRHLSVVAGTNSKNDNFAHFSKIKMNIFTLVLRLILRLTCYCYFEIILKLLIDWENELTEIPLYGFHFSR